MVSSVKREKGTLEMSKKIEGPIEGRYQSAEGEIFSVTNIQFIDEGFYTFELVESEDSEDIDAMSTELTSDDWPNYVRELGFKHID